jgi:hypothetical protein
MSGLRPSIDQAGACVDARVEAVFAQVETVRTDVLACISAPLRRGERPRVADLAPLTPLLRSALEQQTDPRLAGLGFIAEVDVLADQPRWLEWIRRSEDGRLTRLEPDLDPDSFGFYDFTAADWFRRPLATGQRSVVGPYVDFAGTDEYVVTMTLPVLLEDRVLGVCGADLRLGELSDALMASLCSVGDDVALVNADGRVVVSTSPRWQVGALLRESRSTRTGRCTRAPWSLLALESSPLG